MTTLPLPQLHPYQPEPEHSRAPTQRFGTPFHGAGLAKIKEVFTERFVDPYNGPGKISPFTHRTFIVLDERSKFDKTCLIISLPYKEGKGGRARAEFAVAAEILGSCDSGKWELNDGISEREFLDEKCTGGILYTVAAWDKLFA